MTPASDFSAERPSLRTIAQAVGVSAMTVSRAMRNHAAVSAAVRSRVLKAARELGYRPDPQVAKLMHHLRLRHKPAFQAPICALTTMPAETPFQNYSRDILRGAERQARAHGHGFSLLRIDDLAEARRSLQRMLRSRGVEGLLLLPLAQPASLATLLDWEEFSIVTTTSSVLAPAVHSVVPHHFKNTQLLCERLTSRGYRRIGLVLQRVHVERTNHAYPAAMAWHGMVHRGSFVPPLIYAGAEPRSLRTWFKAERPDVVVTNTQRLCRVFAETLGLKIPGRIGFATTNTTAPTDFAGIDELPVQIGARAIDLLTGMIQRGEKGPPSVPTATQLQGRWVEGKTCPRRRPERESAPAPRLPRLLYADE